MTKLSAIAVLGAALALASCGPDETQRDRSGTNDQTGSSTVGEAPLTISMVDIVPGGGKPVDIEPEQAKNFDGNQEQITAGRQLYQAYNCVGCHFNGGGGMGPALMDDHWIYGSSMENIASSIIEGRPNGMPTFRKMVAGDQVWQLAAYVRSLSHLAARDTAGSQDAGKREAR